MSSSKKISLLVLAMAAMIGAANASTAAGPDSDTGNATLTTLTKKAQRAQNRQLAKSVRQALFKAKHLDASNVVVVARGGTVTLVGTVPTGEQVQLAGETAGNVQGVHSVTNNLALREAGH